MMKKFYLIESATSLAIWCGDAFPVLTSESAQCGDDIFLCYSSENAYAIEADAVEDFQQRKYRAVGQNLVVDSNWVEPVIDLEPIKAAMWEEIKAYRSIRLDGGFYLTPHWYHSDLSSKTEFNTLKLKALEHKMDSGDMDDLIVIDGSPTKVKTIDNGYMEISHNKILEIVAAAEIQTKRTYEIAAQHQYFLNLSSTPDSYNWRTGWPAIYGE